MTLTDFHPTAAATEPAARPRLLWLEATEGRAELAGLWSFLRRYLTDLAGDRVSVELRHLPGGAGGVRHPATRLLQDAVALSAAAQAADDADLVVFGCWAAPVLEARALLGIPVTGLAEGSVRLGSLLATRPAVVTVAEGLRPGFDRDLATFGAAGAGLWWLDPASTHEDVLEAVERPGALVDRFDRVARRAVDAGADAVLVGCGYLGPLFTVHGYRHVGGHPDVPVLDCCLLGFQLGTTLLDLRRAGVEPSARAFPQVPPASRQPLAAAMERLRRP